MKSFFNKYKILIGVIWIVLVLFCMNLWFVIEVSAASDQDYFPIEQNKNGHFTDNSISAIANYFDDDNNYIVCYYFDYNYRVIVFPKTDYTNNLGQLCAEKYNNLYQFSLYQLGTLHINTYQFQLMNGTQIINLTNFGSNSWGYWQGLQSSNYNSSIDYVSNLRVWTTNNSSKKLVINYDEEPTYTDPDNDTYPNNFEQPQFNDYVDYSTAPQFDGTSLETMVTSLYNIIKWELTTLLPGTTQFIIDSLNWALQKVINNIRNVIEDAVETISGFLSDIKDWVDDIKDGIEELVDFITNPWDSSEFQTQLANSSFYGAVNTTFTNIRSFGTSFTQANEPTDLSLTINLTAIGWGTSEIDFNWLKSFRHIIRLIIGCVLVYWLIITVITSLNNIISSGGDNEE